MATYCQSSFNWGRQEEEEKVEKEKRKHEKMKVMANSETLREHRDLQSSDTQAEAGKITHNSGKIAYSYRSKSLTAS